MKRRIISIGIVCITILLLCCYLQFGKEMEVYHSTSFTAANYCEEHLNVVINRLIVPDKQKVEEEIIEHCRKMILKMLVSVMMWNIQINCKPACICQNEYAERERGVFFVYDTELGEIGEYNFIKYSEKFVMEII